MTLASEWAFHESNCRADPACECGPLFRPGFPRYTYTAVSSRVGSTFSPSCVNGRFCYIRSACQARMVTDPVRLLA